MVKRMRASLIGILTVFMCFALAFGLSFGVAKATAADAPTVRAGAGFEVVLDKIEDFRTTDNGDGTYTIVGNVLPTTQEAQSGGSKQPDYKDFEVFFPKEDGSNYTGLIPQKTAFSAVGMRKILGLSADDNCGLTQGAGDGVEADETVEQFKERVYSALYAKIKAGDASGKQISVVIPDNVSEIGDGAFLTYCLYEHYSGLQNAVGYAGGNAAFDAFVYSSMGGYMGDWSVDYDLTVEQNRQNFTIMLAENIYGESYDNLTPEELEELLFVEEYLLTMEIGPGIVLPQMANMEFAKKQDGTRALMTVGQHSFGFTRVLTPFTVPANISVADGKEDVSVFSSVICEELEFEEGVSVIPQEYFAYDRGMALKKLTLPKSITSVERSAFNSCRNLTDVTLLSENAAFSSTAFAENVDSGNINVRVASLKQWFTNDFQVNATFPFNSSSSPFAKNTGKMFVPKTDVVDPDDYKDNADFIVEGDKVWEHVKNITITEDILPDGDGGKYIPAFILRGCDLTVVDIACDVTEIGAFAFYGCSSLTEVHFKNVTTIADGAFASTALKSVEFPASLVTLTTTASGNSGTGAFERCADLRSVTFAPSGNLETIGNHAFFRCVNLGRGEDGKSIPLVIPSTVTTIGYIAFGNVDLYHTGETNLISEVRFEDDGNKNRELTMKSAFHYCRNLEKVTLPDCKITLNDSFDSCVKLASLYLPAGAKNLGTFCGNGEEAGGFTLYVNGNVEHVGLSTGTFALGYNKDRTTPVTIVASSYEVMRQFKTALEATDSSTVQDNYTLTYTYNVAVKYMYKDSDGNEIEVSAPSVYTFGDAGADVTFPAVSDAWYKDTALSQRITTAQIAAYIKDGVTETFAENTDTIILYTAKPAKLAFRGASNLVYDGRTYAVGTALNALLHKDSARISEDMTVELKSYTDASGNVRALPETVSAAGEYSFAVTYRWLGEETTSYFDIVIGKRKIDISGLDWRVTSVAGAAFDRPIALQSARLYVYDKGDGSRYASLTRLNTTAGQFEGYVLVDTVDVVGSIARYRNAALTVGFGANANPDMYDISYRNNVYTECGVYDTEAVLTPKNNYELAIGDTSDFADRGLVVVANADGSFTVTKRWYIVQISNWLVTEIDATESDYELFEFDGNTTFGVAPVFGVPYAIFGDVDNNVYFGTNADLMTFRLVYNYNIEIGEFDRKTYGNYINASMPAGRYELIANMETVTHNGELIPAFSRSFVFTVAAKELPEAALATFNNIVKGKTFSFDYDGNMHVLDQVGNSGLAALKTAVAADMPTRTGEWAKSKYDAYYGALNMTYNLDRMQSVEYFTVEDLNDQTFKPIDADKYIVYYLLDCDNYASIVNGSADYDEARRQFVFYVKIVREVEIPTASSVTYNGTAQKADIASSEFYTVNAYDGFTEFGSHDVVLTLVNSEYYRWKGKELGASAATVKFDITKALNDWIEAPDIVRWIEGRFDEEENGFIGAAKFGSISYVITDTNDNVIFDLSQGIDNRAAMKAGTYILKATVAGNDNYSGLSEAFTIRILEKVGLPWWATLLITLGALLVAAAIVLILWKKGVFQILTEKIVVAIRTRASVDATIAAVRAAKREDDAKKSVAAAEAKERAEARKAAAKAEKEKPAEERAAAMEAKARAQAERAEKMRLRAEALQARAARLRDAEVKPEAEAAATEEASADE